MDERLFESNKIELKKELNDKLEKEVVAFLNYRDGGDIYIGVDDDGNAVGFDNIDAIHVPQQTGLKIILFPQRSDFSMW